MHALTSLERCREAKSSVLIVRLLGDGVPKEEELIIQGGLCQDQRLSQYAMSFCAGRSPCLPIWDGVYSMNVLDVLDSSDVAQAACSCSDLAYVRFFSALHTSHTRLIRESRFRYFADVLLLHLRSYSITTDYRRTGIPTSLPSATIVYRHDSRRRYLEGHIALVSTQWRLTV
jgi:hypothetical protein